MNIRTIAIHLPQFHPIAENDAWWGKGFTEWTNVVRARPRFKGHYQPHLPADLGFYDLRLAETREAQATLARDYGIYGFCYYHYWFNGKRVLNQPLDEMIFFKKPDFPFMICWANENWTRSWDGQNNDVLLSQDYNSDDHEAHMKFVCQHFFSDSRYIRVDNKPVFAVYRTELIPDMRITAELWRKVVKSFGFPDIYLIAVESLKAEVNPLMIGFDASMQFQPNWKNLPKRKTPNRFIRLMHQLNVRRDPFMSDRIFDYHDLVSQSLSQQPVTYKRYPSVTPMWDNSARRKVNATIFIKSSPGKYFEWLSKTSANFRPYSNDENFLFINAWNEWAEGNHLEPCSMWGRQYLDATKAALSAVNVKIW